MSPNRRHVLMAGGALLAGCFKAPFVGAGPGKVIDIVMRGNADGSRVWFDPIGLRVEVGQTLRWTNRDPGNSHTTTAYHPGNDEHPLRIPAQAEPWDSDYLLPDQSFSVLLQREGVYDYFCMPHEHAGMVGRIVVGRPPAGFDEARMAIEGVPEAALSAFPAVAEIMRNGVVRLT